MKKTEKIELRVELAEKERLAGIAKNRGQTISDVVRDALANELGTVSVDNKKWPGIVALLALGIATVCLLWLSRGATLGPIMSTTSLYLPDARGGAVLETQIPHTHGFSKTYNVKTETRHLQFTHKVSEIDSQIFQLTAALCEELEDSCLPLGETTLILSSPSEPPRLGKGVVRDGDGIEGEKDVKFFIETLGPSLQMLEEEAS